MPSIPVAFWPRARAAAVAFVTGVLAACSAGSVGQGPGTTSALGEPPAQDTGAAQKPVKIAMLLPLALETVHNKHLSLTEALGALTSRDFRFQARVWNLLKAASTCAECSRGCATQVEVLRELGADVAVSSTCCSTLPACAY